MHSFTPASSPGPEASSFHSFGGFGRQLIASSQEADDLKNVQEDLNDVDVDVESSDDVHVRVELPRPPPHKHLKIVYQKHRKQNGGYQRNYEMEPPALHLIISANAENIT